MRKIFSLSPLWYLGFLLILSSYFYLFFKMTTSISPHKMTLSSSTDIVIEYQINPIGPHIDLNETVLEKPPLDIPPTDIRYILHDREEQRKIKYKVYPYIFFAELKIDEIEKWKDELKILGNYKDLHQMENWWATAKPSLFTINKYKNYTYWEAYLARYHELILRELETSLNTTSDSSVIAFELQKSEIGSTRIIELKNKIIMQQYKINDAIKNIQGTSNQKQYLHRISGDIFSQYFAALDPYIIDYNPHRLSYSLAPILADREYGVYDIELKSDTKIPLTANQITVDETTNRFSIENQSDNIIKNEKWFKYQDQALLQHRLTIPIKPSQTSHHVLIFENKTGKPLILKIMRLENKAQNTHVYKDIRANQIAPYQIRMDLPYSQNVKYALAIESRITLSNSDLQSMNFQLYTLVSSPLKLTKVKNIPSFNPRIEYKVLSPHRFLISGYYLNDREKQTLSNSIGFGWNTQTLSQSPVYQVEVYYWMPDLLKKISQTLFIASILSLGYAIGLHKKVLYRTSHYISIPRLPVVSYVYEGLIKTTDILFQLIRTYRNVLAIVLFLLIFQDIFMRERTSELLLIILMTVWLNVLICFRLQAQVSFVIGFAFLTTIPFFALLEKSILAEKFSIWGYLFLLAGTTQILWQLRHADMYLSDCQTFLIEIAHSKGIVHVKELCMVFKKQACRVAHIIYNFFNTLFNIITLLLVSIVLVSFVFVNYKIVNHNRIAHSFFVFTRKFAHIIFNFFPRSPWDMLFNSIKLLLVSIVLVSFVFVNYKIVNHINHEVKRRQEAELFLKIIPHIDKVEPTLVYQSTKAIIMGSNLGWRPDDRAEIKLKYNNGSIITAFWSDRKIIFEVPLDWDTGNVALWVERPILWKGKKDIIKSNIVNVKVLPRGSTFTVEDDAFFEQLKHVDKEVLKINGYE